MPIPADASLLDAIRQWQVFSLDRALAYPLPLGNSNAMSTTIR